MNTKQQQLIFDKGLTNVPSDAICGDTALEVSEGIIYDGYGNRAIQRRAVLDEQAAKRMVFVHRVPGGVKNYLSVDGSGNVYYSQRTSTESVHEFEVWGNENRTARPTTASSVYLQVNKNIEAPINQSYGSSGVGGLVIQSTNVQGSITVAFTYIGASGATYTGTETGESVQSGSIVVLTRTGSADLSNTVHSFGELVETAMGGVLQIAYLTVDTDITERQIQSIGKTIIFATSSGLVYAIWNGGGYSVYDHIPEPKIEFIMRGDNPYTLNSSYKVGNSENVSGLVDLGKNAALASPNYEKQEEYNNVVLGLYAKNVKAIKEKKGFCEPFMARAALRMYDGSYAYISQPVPLFPSVTKSTWGTASGSWGAATPPVLFRPGRIR